MLAPALFAGPASAPPVGAMTAASVSTGPVTGPALHWTYLAILWCATLRSSCSCPRSMLRRQPARRAHGPEVRVSAGLWLLAVGRGSWLCLSPLLCPVLACCPAGGVGSLWLGLLPLCGLWPGLLAAYRCSRPLAFYAAAGACLCGRWPPAAPYVWSLADCGLCSFFACAGPWPILNISRLPVAAGLGASCSHARQFQRAWARRPRRLCGGTSGGPLPVEAPPASAPSLSFLLPEGWWSNEDLLPAEWESFSGGFLAAAVQLPRRAVLLCAQLIVLTVCRGCYDLCGNAPPSSFELVIYGCSRSSGYCFLQPGPCRGAVCCGPPV